MIPFPFYISVEIRCCKPKFLFSLPFLRSCLSSCSLLYVIELYLINNQVIQEYLLVVTQTIWLFVLLRLLQRKCRMCRISSLVTITVHPRYWINITLVLKIGLCELSKFCFLSVGATRSHNLGQGKLRVDLLYLVFQHNFIRCLCTQTFPSYMQQAPYPTVGLYSLSKLRLFTSSSMTGWGLIVSPLRGLCHSCKLHVHSLGGACQTHCPTP